MRWGSFCTAPPKWTNIAGRMNKPSMFPRMSYCIDGGRLVRPSVFGVRSIYVCMYRNHRRRRGQIERGMPRAHARGLKSLYSMIWPGVREGSEGPGRGRLQAARRRVGRYGSIDGRMHGDGGAAVAARRRRGDLYNISSCKTPSLVLLRKRPMPACARTAVHWVRME